MNWVAMAGIAVGFGLLVVIPVVAILTEHQRKMARILHGQRDESVEKLEGLSGLLNVKLGEHDPVLAEIRALRGEVQELKAKVDSMAAQRTDPEAQLRQKLSNG